MSGEKITNTYKRYLVVIFFFFFWEQSPDDKKSKPHPNLRDPSEAEWCFPYSESTLTLSTGAHTTTKQGNTTSPLRIHAS